MDRFAVFFYVVIAFFVGIMVPLWLAVRYEARTERDFGRWRMAMTMWSLTNGLLAAILVALLLR